MTEVSAVARAMLLGWRHEVVRSLGGSRAAYRGVLVTLALVAVGWTLLAASARSMLGLAALQGGADLRLLLLTTTLNLAGALAAVVTVGLTVLVPEESAFATLLATMPLSPVRRRVALDAPVLGVGLLAALLVSAPFVWLSLASTSGTASLVAVLACWLAVTATGVLLGAAVQRGATLLAGLLLRLSLGVARPVAAVAVYVLVAQQCLLPGLALGRAGSATGAALRALARACTAAPVPALLLAAALPALAAALWWAATTLDGRWPRRARSHLVGPLAGGTRTRPRPLVVLELLQLERHPVNQSTLLVLGAVTAGAAVLPAVRQVLLWPLGGVLLLSVASLLLVGCYGATWSHHWLYRAACARPVGWVAPKWGAALLFWAAVIGALLTSFALTPHWDMRLAGAAAPQLALAVVTSMLVGLAVPASEEQPLSSVVGVVLSAVGGIGLYVATDRLSGGSPPVLLALVGSLAAAGVVVYVRLAMWRERDLVL